MNTPTVVSSAGVEQLSLSDARRIAFERNWDLLAARSGIDSATAQLIVAKEFPNPTLSWSTTKIDPRSNATTLGNGLTDRSYDSIFAINQLVEIGGKRRDRQAAAQAGIVSTQARFMDARRLLELGVTKAYIKALLAEENVRVLNESARSLRHEANIAEVRFNAGDISDADLKQIQNNADTFKLQARSAEALAVQARIAVEILMGEAEPKGNWTPTDSLNDLTLVPPPANPSRIDTVRADVLAAEADLRRSQLNLKLQEAMRVPDPTFIIEYEHEPPGPPGPDTFGVGVSFPLPLWNWNRGNIKAAQATVDQAALALEKLKQQAAADIANAETAYKETFDRLLQYRNQIRPHAAKVRDAVAFAYEKGGASLVDLLTAERDDNNVRLATAQALSDAAGAAADLIAARTFYLKPN